ncbi:hypothetical protein BJ322DRAFT_1439 [Thelephora terrestris]|uniref:Uncharacterized protein n=1 Tax=Thelephora terrestris TaxID=56493 RepID=A0A9P6HPG4_9AGAM|nr:hypothetical protein BJ322DRAFT_1439 [Thelephora terrestris]
MILLPSDIKRVNNAALEEWIKRYDPMWCQFVPHHSEGGNDTVMNDLVHRQLVQRLIDQCLYAVASWDVPNSPGLWNTLLLLPCNTSGLIGAVFSSVGKPELPTPSGPNSLAGPTQLFEDPIQKVVLMTELRSFCPFREPIQVVGRDQHCHGDRLSCHLEPGFDSINSGSESESGSNEGRSRTESPGFCKTPEQQRGWDYTQPFAPQLVEPRTYPEVTGSPQQTFAFDFDVDNGVWVSTDPYLQLGNPLPKDQLDWFTQGLGFPEPLA